MAKVKKQPRPKAETPKGFRDYFGAEVAQRKAMLDQISAVYQLYGFDALESSAVETVEALGFRQFYQCDADTVGSGSVAADAEICAMLSDVLETVGIPRGDYIVRVNNRKVLNGVMEVAGLADDPRRDDVLRTIDKFDKVGERGVKELLTVGRTDASGAKIDGVGLSEDQAAPVLAFLTAKQDRVEDTFEKLRGAVGDSAIGNQGIDELQQIADLLGAQGYGPDRIEIDPSVVRGLGYYTGPVYEAELTFEITDDKGRPRQFGSVAGGGRYDDLVKRFTGQEVPATVGELRAAGIRAEVYLGNPKNFGNQLKYADKRNAPVAVIAGSDEFEAGVVQIKDLVLGAKIAETATHEEWKEQPAQFEIKRGDLVAEVRKILDA